MSEPAACLQPAPHCTLELKGPQVLGLRPERGGGAAEWHLGLPKPWHPVWIQKTQMDWIGDKQRLVQGGPERRSVRTGGGGGSSRPQWG